MKKTNILFVCLGNICRSPMAETIMQSIVNERDAEASFGIDSAGILGYHSGEGADPRMRSHAFQRGYRITHISRQVREDDFYHFDYIIGMDERNMEDLRALAPADSTAELHQMTEYCQHHPDDYYVPDPYYGGAAGFAHVIDLLEDACEGLFQCLMPNA